MAKAIRGLQKARYLPNFIRRLISPVNILLMPTLRCDYSCPYCIIKTKMKFDEVYPKHIEQEGMNWVRALRKIPPARIDISGGEPLIYNGLIPLINNMPKKHWIGSITTNLSSSVDILKEVRNKDFPIFASFHPYEADTDDFKASLLRIKNYGFSISVNVVAYPKVLDLLPEFKKQFEEEVGIDMNICVYEDAVLKVHKYNSRQTEIIQTYIGNNLGSRYKFDNFNLKNCVAGSKCFLIAPNGDVYTCHAGFYLQEQEFHLGNLFDGSFNPLKSSRTCSLPCICPCDVYMAMPRTYEVGEK